MTDPKSKRVRRDGFRGYVARVRTNSEQSPMRVGKKKQEMRVACRDLVTAVQLVLQVVVLTLCVLRTRRGLRARFKNMKCSEVPTLLMGR